jgi:hypothetical protein
MKKFHKGETFKLKGCRKEWTVVKTFKLNGVEHCVAISTLTNQPEIKRLGIFAVDKDNNIYQRAS